MTLSQKNYYPALTGFRALSAFLVFFHHANPFSNQGWQRNLHLLVNEFHVGVSFFFVLSGFLIYLRYNESFLLSKSTFMVYLQNRFARIYPLYFLLTTLTFVILWVRTKIIFNGESVFIYFTNIALLKGFFNELKFSGIAQGWSLTVEECFYFLAPLLFLWWNKSKMFVPAILLAFGSLLVFFFHALGFYGFFADFHFMMIYTFFGRSFEFFVGIALACYVKDVNRKSISWPMTYSGIIGVLVVIAGLASLSENGNSGLEHPAGLILNNFILPVTIALLIYGLIKEDNWIRKVLSSATAQVLGKSSYAFYLIHAGIFYSAIYRFVTANIFLIFVLLNLMAIGIYYLIEKPLHEKWTAEKKTNGSPPAYHA